MQLFGDIYDKIVLFSVDYINPACLPISGRIQKEKLSDNNPFIIGRSTFEQDAKMIYKLQQVQLPIVSNKECKSRYKRVGQFIDNVQFSDLVICAGFTAGIKDRNLGFLGGPLMLPVFENGKFPFYQIGIQSYGYDYGRQNTPNVYTNVQRFLDWIQDKLK